VNSPFAASGLGDRVPRLDLRKSLTSRRGRRRWCGGDAIGYQHSGFARMVEVGSRKAFNLFTDGRAREHGNRQNRRQNTEMKFRFCTIHETSFKSNRPNKPRPGIVLVRASLGVGVPGCERTAKLLGIPSRQSLPTSQTSGQKDYFALHSGPDCEGCRMLPSATAEDQRLFEPASGRMEIPIPVLGLSANRFAAVICRRIAPTATLTDLYSRAASSGVTLR
jgi:hypothetical protein